eukprot:TRINITY_DN453_c0_g1_i1.p1 TRINITY_DN453_c0_g1~~TRINITY_DN453_c0_g1_i1.p1  ORF type:complete len:543 (-),score=156.30 TRINITY_DN453_c0_g1_i1:399-1937(-)
MLSKLRVVQRAPVASFKAARAASTLPAPTFNEVKFVKEDVEKVMMELPDYNFYEMKESTPNPYQGSTLDRSILLDPPPANLVAPKAEFSKLENGMKVASIDKQGLTARLGLFVHAGSRFETAANFGAAHMSSIMAYASTAHLSQLRTVKTLEQLGADQTALCKAGREDTMYQVELQREYVPLAIPLMVGNVLFPRLLPWEVKSAQKEVAAAKAALAANPDDMVNELLHKAAFCNNTLGLSPLASDRSMSYFTPETIRSYLLDHFAPERMVLVGVNVSHAELTKWAMRSFADYNAIPLKKREAAKANYTGGDLRIEGGSPFCHLALGFESVPFGQAELAPVALLQAILGEASTGGRIGSGTTCRLSTQVVKQSPYVESAAAFNTSYSDSGIFGVYGVSQADKAGDMAKAIAKTMGSLTNVSKDELAKAKAMLKGKMFRQADNDSELMKDMGQQLLMTGKYAGPTDFAKLIDGVSESEVTAAAKKILSSKLTLAAYGDTHAVPHYAAMEGAFKA